MKKNILHSRIGRYLTDLSCTWMKNTVADYLLKNSICEIWPGTYNERTTSLAPYYVERTYGTLIRQYSHTNESTRQNEWWSRWCLVTTYRGINMSVCHQHWSITIWLSHLITTLLLSFLHTHNRLIPSQLHVHRVHRSLSRGCTVYNILYVILYWTLPCCATYVRTDDR